MASDYIYLPNEEALTSGIVQEVNRRILHPMGFALALLRWDDGETELRIIDQRLGNDAGLAFKETDEAHALRAQNITNALEGVAQLRVKTFGFNIQPVTKEELETARMSASSSVRSKKKSVKTAEVDMG